MANLVRERARRYRESDEAEAWKKRDPILRVRTYLEREAALRALLDTMNSAPGLATDISSSFT